MLPNFFIIGAMRSGTTSLANYLSQHPDVFIAPTKELHFFDVQFERGLDWYAAFFHDVAGESAVGEATQTYLYDPAALTRLAETVPHARLLAILRNPVDRAYSHFRHNEVRGRETLSFPSALAAEPERLAGADAATRYRYGYVDRGLYHQQLQQVVKHFPHASLRVLLFDDLVSHPSTTYRDVCRFLNVDDAYVPPNLGSAINAYSGFRSPRVRDLSKKLPKPLRDVVGRLNRRQDQYPPMPPSVRAALQARFHDDNAMLARWLGRELPWNAAPDSS